MESNLSSNLSLKIGEMEQNDTARLICSIPYLSSQKLEDDMTSVKLIMLLKDSKGNSCRKHTHYMYNRVCKGSRKCLIRDWGGETWCPCPLLSLDARAKIGRLTRAKHGRDCS